MEYISLAAILAGCFIFLLSLVLFLNIFGLPANWINIGLIALWGFFHPNADNPGFWFWMIILLLGVSGEGLELLMQYFKGKRHGSSSAGSFGGMLGAIIGAIVFAPFLFGLGALFGALAGAWFGCLLFELAKGRSNEEALNAAKGAMLGSFLGTICKIGIGAMIIIVTAWHIWPKGPEVLEVSTLLPI